MLSVNFAKSRSTSSIKINRKLFYEYITTICIEYCSKHGINYIIEFVFAGFRKQCY